MLVVFAFIALICIFIYNISIQSNQFLQKVEAIIAAGQYGFWGKLAVRFPVYEYIWNNEICRYVSHFSDDALETTKATLFIDRDGRSHELKSVVVPIICGVVLGLMLVLKAIG